MANEGYDVFVSYARADWRHAADIDSELRARGLKSFFDRRNLPKGLSWVRALEQAISAAKAMIVLIGPDGFGNTQQYERDLAFFRQTRERTFPVIPVILPKADIDRPFNFLQILTWIDFSRVAKVSDAPEELEHLFTAVQGGQTSAETVREAICPYRGLDAFREEDSAFFFGRGSADDPKSPIGELLRKVCDYPFVMVVGRSGSGKSSLVYAGLLPALRRERDRFWNVLTLQPGTEPLRALAGVFNPKAGKGAAEYQAMIGSEADRLMTGDPELLSHMIRQDLDQTEGKPDRLLLYIDQWEELYAQAPSTSDKERAARHAADVNRFIDLLLNAGKSAPVTVVATVRADFYDPLISHQGIQALLPFRQVTLGSMPRSELERTIVEPARKVGLAFDPPSLVQRILDEAGEDEGMLPLLQYALKETWRLRQGTKMTGDSYAQSGGVREAIRITAERTFDGLSAEDQQAARRLFLRLVTPGEGQEDTRARAAMPPDETLRKIVDQFAGPKTRLLVTGSDREARPTVEVAHEALIRTWPRLRDWIDANREKLRSRAAVLQAKADWEQQDRREDMLLPAGFQLERARALLADPGDLTIDDIQEFIALSSAHEESERNKKEAALAREKERLAEIAAAQTQTARLQRRGRWTLVATAVVIAVFLWFGYWTNQEHQAQLDRGRVNLMVELATWQRQRLDFDFALRLSLHAVRLESRLNPNAVRSALTRSTLAATIGRLDWRVALGGQDYSVKTVAFGPDNSRVLAALSDKTARIWDVETGKENLVLRGHEDLVRSAAFSSDGSRIVTASNDKTARIWDSATGKEIAVLRGHEDSVLSAAFSPNGSRIVTASGDNTARIWDSATGKEIAVLRGNEDLVRSAAFSPDGLRIVIEAREKTRIWNATTGKEIAVLRGHEGSVVSAAFSPNGSRIVTTSDDKTARIWDVEAGKEIATLRGHEDLVGSAAFSSHSSRIVTASKDKTARIWDSATGKEIAVLRGHEGSVLSAAFSPNGSRIVTASDDNTARLWDAETGKEISRLHGHEKSVRYAAFSPNGSRIVTASADGSARIWGTTRESAILRGHEASVTSVAFSRDGSRIVTTSDDNTARIWDLANGKEIAVLRGHEGSVVSAAFSPNGSRIVTAPGATRPRGSGIRPPGRRSRCCGGTRIWCDPRPSVPTGWKSSRTHRTRLSAPGMRRPGS